MFKRSLVASTGLLVTLSLVACGDTADSASQTGTIASEAPPTAGTMPEPVTPPASDQAVVDTPTVGEPAAPAAPAAPAGPDPALIATGQQVFTGAGLCQACHGPTGQGTALAPNLTDGTWIWISDPANDLDGQLATLIRTGIAQPREFPAPMPPANLNDAQIQAVTAYVISLSR